MSNQNYLKVAVAAAKGSEKIFTKYFGKPKEVKMKNGNPRDLVTEIDKQIETRIRQTILKKFPAHKIIGEEFGSQLIGNNDLVWIIDPIDGTTNYIQGLPLCCISIALWDKNGPLIAALFNPISGQLYTAIRGKGARLNGKVIHVSKENKLINALGGVGWLRVEEGIGLFSVMARNCRKLRVLATSALQICLVASGNYDFYVTDDIKIWDFAAAVLVLSEAGGSVTDRKGKLLTLKSKNIVACNGKLKGELMRVLKKIS